MSSFCFDLSVTLFIFNLWSMWNIDSADNVWLLMMQCWDILLKVMHRGVQNTENQFGFSSKNRTVPKFDIRSGGFLTETAYNPQFKLEVTKNNFTCIHCADKEHFQTLLKDSLAYR